MMYVLLGDDPVKDELQRSLDYEDADWLSYDISSDIPLKKIKREVKKRGDPDGILLLSHEDERNIQVWDEIKEIIPENVPVFVRVKSVDERFEELDVDGLLSEQRSLVDTALKNIHSIEESKVSESIADIIRDTQGEVGIFTHNNPDPDAIASALAFETLCDAMGAEATTYYGGDISHPENVLFVEETDFRMERVSEDEVEEALDGSEKLVFMDFARPSVNNLVPEDRTPDIVIDHHYTNQEYQKGGLVQVRTDVGATSTLMIDHLLRLDIEISPTLAAALVYGIKTDTDDFIKNIYPADFKALSYCQKIADKELLSVFDTPPINEHTVSALGRAISAREVENDVLTAYVGKIKSRDDIPQIADFLSMERDVMIVLVYGELDDEIQISARCKDPQVNVGKKMEKAFSDIGSAGGHKHSAGGAIPFSNLKGKDEEEFISSRFREVIQR